MVRQHSRISVDLQAGTKKRKLHAEEEQVINCSSKRRIRTSSGNTSSEGAAGRTTSASAAGPTVTILHVCPPIVVHAQPSEFMQLVQQLTGCGGSTATNQAPPAAAVHQLQAKTHDQLPSHNSAGAADELYSYRPSPLPPADQLYYHPSGLQLRCSADQLATTSINGSAASTSASPYPVDHDHRFIGSSSYYNSNELEYLSSSSPVHSSSTSTSASLAPSDTDQDEYDCYNNSPAHVAAQRPPLIYSSCCSLIDSVNYISSYAGRSDVDHAQLSDYALNLDVDSFFHGSGDHDELVTFEDLISSLQQTMPTI